MDFAVSSEQQAMLDMIEQFVDRHLPIDAQRRRDADRDPPYDLLRTLADTGLMRLPFPKEVGGLGGDWVTVSLVQEALGQRAWMLGSLFNRAIGFGGMSLMRFGNREQKAALLPELMAGRLLVALALTEEDAGSDAAAVKTRAEHADGIWRLTGRKVWISDAERADFLVAVARTEEGSLRSDGLTLFLVPRDTPGVACYPIEKIGNHCLPTFEVVFDRAELPETAVFGDIGKGFANLAATLHYARAGLAAAAVGYAQFAMDLALSHARHRRQFGRTLGDNQALAHRLVDMQMRIDQARLIVRELAWRIDQGVDAARQASQAKIIATECLHEVASKTMQLLASQAYHSDSDSARVWRDSRLYTFGEGANEIQRNIVARKLGLGDRA